MSVTHELAETEQRNGFTYIRCSCGIEIGPFHNPGYAQDAFDVHSGDRQPRTGINDGPPHSIIDYPSKEVRESPVDWHKRWADLEWEHKKLNVEIAETRRTLARLISLIDTGVLVRNISRDDEPGWGVRMLELVTVLQAAKEETTNG